MISAAFSSEFTEKTELYRTIRPKVAAGMSFKILAFPAGMDILMAELKDKSDLFKVT
jgi:hypothetical protein